MALNSCKECFWFRYKIRECFLWTSVPDSWPGVWHLKTSQYASWSILCTAFASVGLRMIRGLLNFKRRPSESQTATWDYRGSFLGWWVCSKRVGPLTRLLLRFCLCGQRLLTRHQRWLLWSTFGLRPGSCQWFTSRSSAWSDAGLVS